MVFFSRRSKIAKWLRRQQGGVEYVSSINLNKLNFSKGFTVEINPIGKFVAENVKDFYFSD